MAATVAGILLAGDHASRPAAGSPPVGSLYSCSDHDLVYQTDGSSWSTWADLTAAPAIDFGEDGDISASAPGDTAAAGSTGEVADAGHRHAREAAPAADKATVNFIIDGGGSAIGAGIKGDIYFHAAWTIEGVTLLADQGGAIVVDLWVDTYANHPPTDADSITASAPPTITATNVASQDTTLTGWDTAIEAGKVMRVNVDSATTVTRVTLALHLVRA